MSGIRPALRVAVLSVVVLSVTVVFVPVAWSHAAYQSSDPQPGARVDEPPGEITVAYTEPPTNASTFRVLDGCDRSVADFSVLNDTITAQVIDAQPGRWRVEWSVVSAVDGHLTRDNFSFTVRGNADCSQAAVPEETDVAPEGEGLGALLPIAIASFVIVAVALGVRLATWSKP